MTPERYCTTEKKNGKKEVSKGIYNSRIPYKK